MVQVVFLPHLDIARGWTIGKRNQDKLCLIVPLKAAMAQPWLAPMFKKQIVVTISGT